MGSVGDRKAPWHHRMVIHLVLAGGAGRLEPGADEVLRLTARLAAAWFALLGVLALWGRRALA